MVFEYTKTGREYTEGREDILPGIFASLEWAGVDEPRTVGMMPAMAIQQIIKEQKGRHTHYAVSHALAPFGLIGIHSAFMQDVADALKEESEEYKEVAEIAERMAQAISSPEKEG